MAYNFFSTIRAKNLDLSPTSIDTLQVNVTKLCNQACKHCHVDASPVRTEQMDLRTVDRCLEVLRLNEGIRNLDITGGAPELNRYFEYFVVEAKKIGKHVMVRHNLTVTLDVHPTTGESMQGLPAFFAANGVEVISSLPFHQKYFTDKQRGAGVFAKSIESLKLLNAKGYGQEVSPLKIHLVYNPVGSYFPPAQANLEKEFKRELLKYGVTFNQLFTITNMPINRFQAELQRTHTYDAYMEKLVSAFNPAAASGIMCRSMISVGYDGTLYDCDFNQMTELRLDGGVPQNIFDFDADQLLARRISFDDHCFGCTAGAGSSCGGATTTA